MIFGPDVSGYQPSPRWHEVRGGGCDLAIVKVTEGNSSTNPHATNQIVGAASAGLLVMAYHFARPNGPNWLEDAAAEAKRFDELVDAAEQKIGRGIFAFLDVERNTPLLPAEKPNWRTWANEFRRWSREEGRRHVGWYSGKYFTTDLGLDSSWSNTVLWLAQYPATFRADCNYGFWPTAIAPWKRADIWQHGGGDALPYGNASRCPGVDGPCDFNTFTGSREELSELIDIAA